MIFVSTTEKNAWEPGAEVTGAAADGSLVIGGPRQEVDGFGGCFNELGMKAMSGMAEEERIKIFDELFGEAGCGFNMGRLSVGANDFSESWYSYNETDGDYQMEHFSIERDHKYVIPYLKEGLKRCPDMQLFASPWSPPAWMKFPKVCNYGQLVDTPENLKAYALYFKKYVEAYQALGIHIHQIHVQNEFFSDQKFPSCVWSGEMLEKFIAEYLSDALDGLTEIWYGTMNGPETDHRKLSTRYNQFLNLCMQNEKARNAIAGVSLQWAGRFAAQQIHDDYPELKIIQSESECGDGQNTWLHAMYIFELACQYFRNGARAYIYWNMILQEGGESSWGWTQNSMVSIVDNQPVFNPELYVMKHFSHFVKRGARVLRTQGNWSSNATVFRNPNGETVVVLMNPFAMERTVAVGEKRFILKPNSFNTIVL